MEIVAGNNGNQTAYDWPKIGTEYIEGDPSVTLDFLVEKYGCGIRNLAQHSSDENWVAKRHEFREEIARRFRHEAIKRHVKIRRELLDHQAALIASALRKLYDPETKTLRGDVALLDLDRLLNTYDKFVSRETGESTVEGGTQYHIHLAEALVAVGIGNEVVEGLLERVARMRRGALPNGDGAPPTGTDGQ